jgi:hypothetical protein
MIRHRQKWLFPVLVFSLVFLCQCGSLPDIENIAVITPRSAQLYPTSLPPAQQYAGEVLSYMIQVVTGMEGKPGQREQWRTRGVGSHLALKDIVKILSDPDRDNSRIMVYDLNVLGLSKVLYHYDVRLNQFKGEYSISGFYPSAELLALRLLLVDLINDGIKVDLPVFYRLLPDIMDENFDLSRFRDGAAGLSFQMLKLLRAVLSSEPHLEQYLRHPFLMGALNRAGVLQESLLVDRMVRQAGYQRLDAGRHLRKKKGEAVVAILPSIIGTYRFDSDEGSLNGYGFSAEAEYTRVVEKLEQKILSALENGQNQVAFKNLHQRPLVVYPENADRVIRDVCPEADIVIVILGKNVEKSIHIDPEKDIYPAVNRYYFDIMDVK